MCYDQVLHGDPNPTSRLSGIGATGALAYQVSRFKHMHADRNRQAKRLSLWLSQHVHGSYETLAKWMLLPSCHPGPPLTICALSLLNVLVAVELLPELQFTLLHTAASLPFIWTQNCQDKTHQNSCDSVVLTHPSSWLTKGHSGGSASLRATGDVKGWLLGIGSVGGAFRNKLQKNHINSKMQPEAFWASLRWIVMSCAEYGSLWLQGPKRQCIYTMYTV